MLRQDEARQDKTRWWKCYPETKVCVYREEEEMKEEREEGQYTEIRRQDEARQDEKLMWEIKIVNTVAINLLPLQTLPNVNKMA
ncbi:hypothetical protein E2C01_054755 [Portunus trituberculatus]|uniref:Uncharacterized protein n=1 Tax=Portunus trituberculatus TaxID=210409 RepID=A0A5B7GST2_PORTR|nr:hypothetical protein [Portunus trituberculatus]